MGHRPPLLGGKRTNCQNGRPGAPSAKMAYIFSSNVSLSDYRYSKYPRRKIKMLTLFFLYGMMGYGVGYEGYSDGKLYVGLYTSNAEYGYVVTDREIYLDTVFEKK
jgi:hypothetical protein